MNCYMNQDMNCYMNKDLILLKVIQNKTVNKFSEFINILESNGINMDEQKEYLRIILNRWHKKQATETFLFELGSLEENLSSYKSIVNIIKIIEELTKMPYSEEQVFSLIENLKECRSNKEIECPKNIIESALNCIFTEIQEEIKHCLDSKTFDMVSNDEFYTNYFNEFIKKKIEEINLSSFLNYPEMLETLQNEINRCKNNLFDKRLLTSLIACQEKEELMNSAKTYHCSKIRTLDANTFSIKRLNESRSLYYVTTSLKDYKDLILSSKKRIPYLFLTGILLTGISLGIPTFAKKLSTKVSYKTTTEKYMLDLNLHSDNPIESYEELLNENGLQVTLTLQSELTKINHNHYHRTETVYDLTSTSIQDPYYYLDLDLSSIPEKSKVSETTLECTLEEYTGEIRNLTIVKQDLEMKDDYLDEEEYKALCGLSYITIFASMLIPNFPLFNLIAILVNLMESHHKKQDFKKHLKLLSEELERCHKLISENEEIRNYYNFLLNSGIMSKKDEFIEKQLSEAIKFQKVAEARERECLELKKIKM